MVSNKTVDEHMEELNEIDQILSNARWKKITQSYPTIGRIEPEEVMIGRTSTPFGRLLDLIVDFNLYHRIEYLRTGIPELPMPLIYVSFGQGQQSVDSLANGRFQNAKYPVNQAIFLEDGTPVSNHFLIKIPSTYFTAQKTDIIGHESWEISIEKKPDDDPPF